MSKELREAIEAVLYEWETTAIYGIDGQMLALKAALEAEPIPLKRLSDDEAIALFFKHGCRAYRDSECVTLRKENMQDLVGAIQDAIAEKNK